MTTEMRKARRQEAVRMYRDGGTLKAIGRHMGVSMQAVHQWLIAEGQERRKLGWNLRRAERERARRGAAGDKLPRAAGAPMKCAFCSAAAVVVIHFANGCVCYPEPGEQALCPQHVVSATPLGPMEVRRILNEEVWKWMQSR